MNKKEKLICVVLGVVLAVYIFQSMRDAKKARESAASAPVAQVATTPSAAPQQQPVVKPAPAPVAAKSAAPEKPSVPEKVLTLENAELKLSFSSWGAVIKEATLKDYARNKGAVSEENPPLVFNFESAPLGTIEGVANLAPNAAYEVRNVTSNEIVFVNAALTRKYTLLPGYKIQLEEHFATVPQGRTYLTVGSMAMGGSKNDLLSVDSWAMNEKGGAVIHHGDSDSPLKPYLVGSTVGCSGKSSAAGLPLTAKVPFPGEQKWVALKDRFFVTALVDSTLTNVGFESTITRDAHAANYRPERISARAAYDAGAAVRTSTFYVGPKKQSLLWDMGMKDVMEFGMWRWVCYPLVWVLNVFHGVIPSFGIAIILLTILVRLIFWPLTHKSTVGMKKMQEIQPLMKELQAKYKDNPKRLQQETWQLYKDRKVNPMSSCLPMLVQIPVFIALFNVLRAAVELRYAGFLWIPDLSEPEGLFASWFPFGGLNILPILMAATMALQSALTPSTGDKSQQRMMMVIMPVMMLVMFYSFPSALSLYWTVSQVLSIVQMWLIRRASAKATPTAAVEVIDPPQTRQMRRHAAE